MRFKRCAEVVENAEELISRITPAKDEETVAHLLREYKDATYDAWDERHRFYQSVIDDMVNDCGFKDDELADYMSKNHPTLQQSFMRMCVKFIRKMAEKTYFDGRNESSVLLARKMLENIDNDYLPFV